LLRAQAAALNADTENTSSHAQAAALRCELIAGDIAQRLGADDPIGGPLLEVLTAAKNAVPGSSVLPLLTAWAKLPLPVTVIEGPRQNRFADRANSGEKPTDPAENETPVAVVLASLDGRLITGPEVLRDKRVYALSVRVHTGDWPSLGGPDGCGTSQPSNASRDHYADVRLVAPRSHRRRRDL
jgi:hypothetical protein